MIPLNRNWWTRHNPCMAQMYVNKEEAYYASMASEVEQANKDGKHGTAWKVIDKMTGRMNRSSCKITAHSQQERLSLWKNHFSQLLTSRPPDVNLPVFSVYEGVLPVYEGPISLDEITTAASQLKMCKACGSIPPELLRLTGIQEVLLPVLNHVFETGQTPENGEYLALFPFLRKEILQCVKTTGA